MFQFDKAVTAAIDWRTFNGERDMNSKRNGLIAAALVLFGVVVLLALFKMNNPDEMGSPKNTETKSETM